MDERGQSASSFSPPGSDASFIVTRYGGLAHIEATSVLTHTWLSNYASNEATWDGSALIVEMRFFADFVEAALADGLRFETASGSSQDDCPKLAAVEFDETHIHFVTAEGSRKSAPLTWFPKLARGTSTQLSAYEIDVDGLSVRWPILDEDLHLQGVITVQDDQRLRSARDH